VFKSWARRLIEENQPWFCGSVLDLACGTGVVTKKLAQNVAPWGKVFALDINSQMLDLARAKCSEWSDHIEFIEGSADQIDIADSSIDRVVCQQGFQFFPDNKAVVREIYRVLKPNGDAIISTWCSVEECQIFGVICETLESMNENEISRMMRIPFDFLTQDDLLEPFRGMGFSKLKISKEEEYLCLEGGISGAIDIAYATPIGPSLRNLSNEKQAEFRKTLMLNLEKLVQSEGGVGKMVSNILVAEK
jgi:ubiquinone/menaquinone biosynthesis C-methylase UbiE